MTMQHQMTIQSEIIEAKHEAKHENAKHEMTFEHVYDIVKYNPVVGEAAVALMESKKESKGIFEARMFLFKKTIGVAYLDHLQKQLDQNPILALNILQCNKRKRSP